MTLKEKQAQTLDQKIYHFYEVVDTYYHKLDGKVYCAFSGGKDSTVMVYLLDKWCSMMKYEKIPLVFNNTTNEYSEILDYVKGYGDRVIWLRPKITFAQSLVKYGYPLISKEQSQMISEAKNTKSDYLRDLRINGKIRVSKNSGKEYKSVTVSKKWLHILESDIEVTSKCCDVLKKWPVKKFEKEFGLSAIIGTTADESNLRKQQYIKNGCNTFGERNICRPLSIFTEKDIWELILRENIILSTVYYDKIVDGELVKGEKRTGCAYCAFGVQYENPYDTKFHRLKKREPKRFNSIMEKLGYRKALELIGIDIDSKPIPDPQLRLFD
jgi:3'-phosphoadenosine 5'-phosphosulfate sulfotransferase (PAPS reductase)/FAD synthetase